MVWWRKVDEADQPGDASGLLTGVNPSSGGDGATPETTTHRLQPTFGSDSAAAGSTWRRVDTPASGAAAPDAEAPDAATSQAVESEVAEAVESGEAPSQSVENEVAEAAPEPVIDATPEPTPAPGEAMAAEAMSSDSAPRDSAPEASLPAQGDGAAYESPLSENASRIPAPGVTDFGQSPADDSEQPLTNTQGRSSSMADYQSSLNEAMQIDGALGAALVDSQSGMALAPPAARTASTCPLPPPATPMSCRPRCARCATWA